MLPSRSSALVKAPDGVLDWSTRVKDYTCDSPPLLVFDVLPNRNVLHFDPFEPPHNKAHLFTCQQCLRTTPIPSLAVRIAHNGIDPEAGRR